MVDFGARLAGLLAGGECLYLEGELGAGKTTLVRGIVRALGHPGTVKSPTYTLVEPYQLSGMRIFHLDLYRLGDPEELEWIGVRDCFAADAVTLIEWPQRGRGVLPAADIRVRIEYAGEARDLHLTADSECGAEIVNQLAETDNSTDS